MFILGEMSSSEGFDCFLLIFNGSIFFKGHRLKKEENKKERGPNELAGLAESVEVLSQTLFTTFHWFNIILTITQT